MRGSPEYCPLPSIAGPRTFPLPPIHNRRQKVDPFTSRSPATSPRPPASTAAPVGSRPGEPGDAPSERVPGCGEPTVTYASRRAHGLPFMRTVHHRRFLILGLFEYLTIRAPVAGASNRTVSIYFHPNFSTRHEQHLIQKDLNLNVARRAWPQQAHASSGFEPDDKVFLPAAISQKGGQ